MPTLLPILSVEHPCQPQQYPKPRFRAISTRDRLPIGQMKGNDPHVQTARAQAQLALNEVNAALAFMNTLAKNAGNSSTTKKKTKR
ncbi:MAG: hypothetical protein FJ271_32640 [Planctomycetes bacterium]|nr:hypothetical protein [Planctomycetota bacterium]